MDLYSVEYINSLEASGIPSHLRHLKKGCIVMCLRNVSPETGCYNGSRMIVNDVVNNKILRCTIINESNAGEEISITRIKLRPQDLTNHPCEWERLQFPVRLGYEMTINKSQGQAFAKLGVWLVTAVFGQLHVAASRRRVHFCHACSHAIQARTPLYYCEFGIKAHSIVLDYFCFLIRLLK
jgi:ATP-dependent DNA helicase PIF1